MTTTAAHSGWLYSRSFDGFFIYGVAALAVACGLLAYWVPAIAPAVIMANLWALGYHHVIGTFTRLCFDRESHRRSILLIYALFPAVAGIVVLLTQTVGLWTIATIYLYGQWFHYARQSWGVSRAYERTAPQGYVADRSWQTQLAFYSFPAWGILYRSYQNPDSFLGLPTKFIPVSYDVVMLAGAVSIGFFALWLTRVYRDWRAGTLPAAYVGFMLSHFFIFFVAYIAIPSIDYGWLVANIWHNLQYLLFVWLFNNRTYRAGTDRKAPLLSFLSQRRNIWIYFSVTLLISTAVYLLVNAFGRAMAMLPLLVIVYMSINFHHYIVDAIIWRVSWIRRGSTPPPAKPSAP